MDTSFVYSYNINEPDIFTKPIIGVLIGSFLTLFITFFVQYINSKNTRKKIKKYLINSIEALAKATNEQNKCINKHIVELEKLPNNLTTLKYKTGFHLKKIKVVSPKEMYEIFVLKRKGEVTIKSEVFNSFIDTIEAIRVNKKQLFNYFKEMNKLNENAIDDYNKYFPLVTSIMTNFVEKPILKDLTEAETKKFIMRKNLNEVFNKFYENGILKDRLFYDQYNNLISPAYNIAARHLDDELSNLIIQCFLILHQFVHRRNSYLEYLKRTYSILDEKEKTLQETVKFLKEKN